MSPPSTHTGGLLEERAQAPEGAHLGHADRPRRLAEGGRHFGRRQAADDPQLEQLTLVGVEAGESGAHLGLLVGGEDDLGGARAPEPRRGRTRGARTAGPAAWTPQHFFPEGHESDKDLFALEAPTPLWRVGGSVPADRKLTMCYRRRSSTIFPVTARLTRAAKASLTRSRGRTSANRTRSLPSARAVRAAAFPAAACSSGAIRPP